MGWFVRLFSGQNSQLVGKILFCPDNTLKKYFEHWYIYNYSYHNNALSMVFLGNIFRGGGGGKPMFREIEGGRRLELKYIKLILMYFAACPCINVLCCMPLFSI